MAKLQRHRGPDDEGVWHDTEGRCSLAHRRLSIIDTSAAGHQPMSDDQGRWVISFNGEIYNFQELRTRLEGRGVTFRGRTDTEVLLQAIALWGTDALIRLDGMFAFAAFDRQSGQLILARDAFGEKPLYYAELPDHGLVFASELQALEAVPGVDLEASVDAMAELLMFQYIGAPRTIYRQIRKLPPGHWLVSYPGQGCKVGRYFGFMPGAHGFDDRPLAQLTDDLEDILVRSLRRRLIADVPLGAFLSGGVDSSTVCALISRRLNVPLKTYSIGFADAPESEHQTARQFAMHLGTEHHERIVAPQASEFLMGVGALLDEPNADSSCLPTYLLSAFARESVTVALSGDGGDEMFAGYGRYFDTLDESERHAGGSSGWDPGKAYYSNRILVSTEEHLVELFGAVPSGAADHLEMLREDLRDAATPLLCRLRQTDVTNYLPGAVLPKVDRMSMQHSLEVRTPFLNVELARFAERLRPAAMYGDRRGKLILREIAYRYLPRTLIDLPKQGFGLPMMRWGREELLAVAGRLLESDDSRLRQSLGSAAIARFMKRQRANHSFATYQVWALAMLESWLRHHPARLPSLHTSSLSADPGVRGKEDWTGIVMGGGILAAVQGDSHGGSPESLADLENRVQQVALHVGLLEFIFDEDRAADATYGRQIPLSAHALNSAAIRPRLKGSTLIMVDMDGVKSVPPDLLDAWRAAGVARVILPHPVREWGTFLVLQFNHHVGWRKLLSLLRLWRAAVASWWGFFAHRMAERGLLHVGPLKQLDGPVGTELCHRYALFRGLRQLSPLAASHDAIDESTHEGYSIWSRHCVYKPPRRLAALQRYWLVEATDSTRHLLPMTVEIIERATYDFLETLQHKIAQQSFAAFPRLQRGDPVVVYTHSLQPGGAERQWCYLAIGLKQRGLEVSFVVQDRLEDDRDHYRSLLEPHGIKPIELPRYSVKKALANVPRDKLSQLLLDPRASPFGIRLLQLTACLVETTPKAVFAQLDTVNLQAGVASVIAEVPRCVLSFRNYNPTNFPYLRNDWLLPCYQELLRSSRIVLAGNSRAANSDYAAWLGVPDDRVAFVPNAIEIDDFQVFGSDELAPLRSELSLSAETPVILGVFRLSEEKDPRTFLLVCAAVATAVPNLRVLVAGVGRLQNEMEALIKSLGLESKVALLGRRTDVTALMSIASLLLLTSTHEGMPNVVMEAQLLGLPVVATTTGGTPDIVVDGMTGYLRPVGDVPKLAESCISILCDSSARRRMRAASRMRMTEAFSRPAMVDRYIALVSTAEQTTTTQHSDAPREAGLADKAFRAS
jgi:asparagine synthase (glutamine-hydrolysing)